jgi:hypothetical protein
MTIVSCVNMGKWAAAIRQVIDDATQVTGVAPYVTVGASPLLFVPKYSKCIFTYCDPRDETDEVAEDGGEFVFSPPAHESYSVRITEVQLVLGAGSVVDVYIVDSDGTHARKILSGVGGNDTRNLPTAAYVLAHQKLTVVESNKGVPVAGDKSITVYAIQEGRI